MAHSFLAATKELRSRNDGNVEMPFLRVLNLILIVKFISSVYYNSITVLVKTDVASFFIEANCMLHLIRSAPYKKLFY